MSGYLQAYCYYLSCYKFLSFFLVLWCLDCCCYVDFGIKTLLPHLCYITKFGCSRSYRLSVSRGGVPNYLGTLGSYPLGWGRGWPPENMLLHHLCYLAKFGHSGPDCVIMEICQENLTRRIPHFRVTESLWKWHRLISYLWLPINGP